MQTLSSHENSVCLSVFQSVQRVICEKNERKLCPHSYTTWKTITLVSWQEEWLMGATPCTGNFGSNWPCWSEIADFQSIIARSAWAVTPSEKSSININRKSTTLFTMSLRWTSYIAHKPTKEAQKRKVSKIWTITCDNSETVRDRMSVTINH